MTRDEEKQFLITGADMVEEVTGQRPIGYNCNWLRRGPNTLSLLQELGSTVRASRRDHMATPAGAASELTDLCKFAA
jgi:hypothetical protein